MLVYIQIKRGADMNNLEIAVKAVADYLESELNDDYYADDEISSWSEMLECFGWDSEDAKDEIRTVLWDYANENHVDCDLNDDDELENGNEFVPYKKLVNAIRKEMKARKLFK